MRIQIVILLLLSNLIFSQTPDEINKVFTSNHLRQFNTGDVYENKQGIKEYRLLNIEKDDTVLVQYKKFYKNGNIKEIYDIPQKTRICIWYNSFSKISILKEYSYKTKDFLLIEDSVILHFNYTSFNKIDTIKKENNTILELYYYNDNKELILYVNNNDTMYRYMYDTYRNVFGYEYKRVIGYDYKNAKYDTLFYDKSGRLIIKKGNKYGVHYILKTLS